jgi:dihydroflavonol-4-reductase
MSSQILITGATGFIGRQLTRDLVSQGANVRVLARSPKKAQSLFGDDVEIVPGDVCDDAAVDAACRGIETIYHIAGTYRFGLRHRRELWRTNVEGAENLFRSAAVRKVGRVVHLSSGGVLRKRAGAGDRLIDESDFPDQPPRFCAYKTSKWHAERSALAWAERGLPVVIASTTCPIGRGDESPTPTGRIIRDFIQGRFPFYCRTGLNFIGVGDLSRGLQCAAESGRAGQRYLLTDENLWLKEFLDLLAQETGMPAPRMRLPDGLIFLIGCGGDAVDLLNPYSTGARVCIETALQAKHRQFFNHAKTCAELGWKPVSSIQENIGEAVAWFRSETEVELAEATSSLGTHVR